MSSAKVLDSLRTTRKGGLVYDKSWNASADRTTKTLDGCTSPPALCAALISRVEMHRQKKHADTSDRNPKTSRQTPQSLRETRHTLQSGELQSVDVGMARLQYYHGVVAVECRAREQTDEKELEDLLIKRQLYHNSRYQAIREHAGVRLQEVIADMEQQQEIWCGDITDNLDQLTMQDQQERMKSQHSRQSRWKEIDDIMKAGEAKRQQITEEERKKAEEMRKRLERLERMKSSQVSVSDVETKAKHLLLQCQHKRYLPRDVVIGLMKELEQNVERSSELVNESEREGATETSVQSMDDLERNARQSLQKIEGLIHAAEAKAKKEVEIKRQQEQAKVEAEAHRKIQEEREKQQEEERRKKQTAVPDTSQAVPSTTLPAQLVDCVSPTAYTLWVQLKKKLGEVAQLCAPLGNPTTESAKKLKLELQKAVAHPVNAVSSQSAAHLRDKVARLSNLLSGKTVTIADVPINAKTHPQGRAFCLEYLAKKLVHKAAQQVSSKHESAFPLAAVATAVWELFPDLGQLLLAHFYSVCPYTVPFYIPKKSGQSDTDYCRSLGYLVNDDGSMEEGEQYLKRMSGVVRFYAAIIQSTPPSGSQAAHPHGVEHGWIWLARLVNLRPRLNITATLLFGFLEVAGHALLQAYGKQFRKLLASIITDFYPKIEAVTPEDKRGPLARLRQFLEMCVKSGNIPKPEGYLSPAFWTRPSTPPPVELTGF